jgi:hypothetical protein
VTTTCRTDANGLVGSQELRVQRGERAPVIVSQRPFGPVPDPLALCRAFGVGRYGVASVLAGFYTGVGVSPDGARVVFELSDRFSLLGAAQLGDDEKGLYMANADGTELVKLGPPTGVPAYQFLPHGSIEIAPKPLAFSPDGRYVVYSDLGRAVDGSTDAQLWSLRLADRKRTQLTSVAKRPGSAKLFLGYTFDFANPSTVGFYTVEYDAQDGRRLLDFYSVAVNGSRFRKLARRGRMVRSSRNSP